MSGPVLGNQIWRLVNRRHLASMEVRDRGRSLHLFSAGNSVLTIAGTEFYDHIVKNRVDPSRQSVSNPVPDYYCEKVGTLKQYRQW